MTVEIVNEGIFFSFPKNSQFCVEDIITVFEEQLKAGLHEGASILLKPEDYNQSDYIGFSMLQP